MIAMKITQIYQMPFNIQFIISAIVASLTVSGKALGKGIAQRESTPIVHLVGTIMNKFSWREERKKKESRTKKEVEEVERKKK